MTADPGLVAAATIAVRTADRVLVATVDRAPGRRSIRSTAAQMARAAISQIARSSGDPRQIRVTLPTARVIADGGLVSEKIRKNSVQLK